MGNPKKKEKSKSFGYIPSQEELEDFMHFLEDLQEEILNSTKQKIRQFPKKKTFKKTRYVK